MRVSPLGIFGAGQDRTNLALWARQDAEITHPNPMCLDANALYVMAIAHAIDTGADAQSLYGAVLDWAGDMDLHPLLRTAMEQAAVAPPANYARNQGWLLIAFQNAFWQLLHAGSLEEGIVDTVMRGGDTDTNAAICGALLGAVHGRAAVPEQWTACILNCRPEAGKPGVRRPRPECFWPVDALEIAEALLTDGRE